MLKKPKSEKLSAEDDVPSELHKYAPEKFVTRLLKCLNKISVSEHCDISAGV
jgi:hypothetical protein